MKNNLLKKIGKNVVLPLAFAVGLSGCTNKEFNGTVQTESKNLKGKYFYQIQGEYPKRINVLTKKDVFDEGDSVKINYKWKGTKYEYVYSEDGKYRSVKGVPVVELKSYKILNKKESGKEVSK